MMRTKPKFIFTVNSNKPNFPITKQEISKWI